MNRMTAAGGQLEPGGQGVLWSNPFINKQTDWSKINTIRSCQCGADGRITPPRTGTGHQALDVGRCCCAERLQARLEAFCRASHTGKSAENNQSRHLSISKLSCGKEMSLVSFWERW